MNMPDETTDVLVVGAGASGIPAAIAAARAGARVILIDEDAYPGGAAVDMGVSAYCGLPRTGIVKEVENALSALEGASGHTRWFMPSSWMAVYRELLARAGVRLLLNARAIGAVADERDGLARVTGATIERGTGRLTIRASVVIDATGNGAVALAAGGVGLYGEDAKSDFDEEPAPDRRTDKVQNVTWMYVTQRPPGRKTFDMSRLDNYRCGVLVEGLGWWHSDPEKALALETDRYLHWGCSVTCADTRDPLALGEAGKAALEAMERDHALLRENGYTVQLAPRIGVRESWRIAGDHVISLGDLRSGKHPADKIAEGWYGIDIWGGAGKLALCKPLPAYGIPYRATLPKNVDGLFVVGRAMSGTHIAMSAYRVMPIVGAIGQAIGVAAALCVKLNALPRRLDPGLVRQAVVLPPQNLRLDWPEK
jgi:hypothetical protein